MPHSLSGVLWCQKMYAIPDKWAGLPYLTQQSPDEWSAACPECGDSGHVGRGDPDRFRIFTDGKVRGWCRSCGFQAFGDSSRRLSVREQEEAKRERVERATLERARVNKLIEKMTADAVWKAYHDGMEDAHRQLWRNAGIDDAYQDWWELGYNPAYSYSVDDVSYTTPTMTIPFWNGDDVVNLQQRLLKPARPNDKYRFAYNVPAAMFLPERTPPEGRCIIFEGAKKTMVSWPRLAGDTYGLFDSCVGVPSKYISARHAEELSSADSFLLCLDPDALEDGSIVRAANILGRDKVRVVMLPYKIDDLFIEYGATSNQIASFIRDAMPLR